MSRPRSAAGTPLLAALLLAAAAPTQRPVYAAAEPAGTFRIAPPARSVLKNGLTVLILERRTIPLVQFQLMIKAGSVADPAGKEGVAALTARLLKRGTRNRMAPQFAEEVEFVGGTLGAHASLESTLVSGEFASRDAEVAFNLLADMVLNPAFREEEVQKEKRQVLAGILGLLDEPRALADRAFDLWLYGGHPYGRPVEGWKSSVEGLTREDVAAFYTARYAPGNAVLAIAGDVGSAETAQRVQRYFGSWKKRSVALLTIAAAPPVKGRKVLIVDKPDATQSQIVFGNVALKRSDPDFFPLAVGNTILGGGFTSWLVDEVRVKRGLTYSIRSSVEAHRAPGLLSVSTFSRNASVAETIQVALEQLAKLRAGTVPAEDLDKARNFMVGLYPLQIETPGDQAEAFLEVDLYGLDAEYVNQYQRRVRAVGIDAVKRAAARYVSTEDLAIVVVGPASELKGKLAPLGPVTVRPLDKALEP
jgi:predicted Zn-dependent peptidase